MTQTWHTCTWPSWPSPDLHLTCTWPSPDLDLSLTIYLFVLYSEPKELDRALDWWSAQSRSADHACGDNGGVGDTRWSREPVLISMESKTPPGPHQTAGHGPPRLARSSHTSERHCMSLSVIALKFHFRANKPQIKTEQVKFYFSVKLIQSLNSCFP